MARIEEIYMAKSVDESSGESVYTLRLDWDNDRHQAKRIKGRSPDAVIDALLDTVHLLTVEKRKGHI